MRGEFAGFSKQNTTIKSLQKSSFAFFLHKISKSPFVFELPAEKGIAKYTIFLISMAEVSDEQSVPQPLAQAWNEALEKAVKNETTKLKTHIDELIVESSMKTSEINRLQDEVCTHHSQHTFLLVPHARATKQKKNEKHKNQSWTC